MNYRNNSSLSFGLLILRVVLGATFLMHGLQKLNEWTIAGTTESFNQMGVPAAEFMAPFQTWLELIGGVLLILGLGTRVVSALFAITMMGALIMVHAPAGFYAAKGGYELVLLLAAAALALVFTGPGAFAIDSLFSRRKGVESSNSSVRA